jgi:LytS/YehU family sensor histidine kinase
MLLLKTHNPKEFQKFNLAVYFINTLIFIILFYLNYLIYIPKFLITRKILKYTILVISTTLFTVLAIKTISVIFDFRPPQSAVPGGRPDYGFYFVQITFSFLLWSISTGIKMTNEWFKNENQKAMLEKERSDAELAYLKSQIDPHFFFNVLNNICSLARKKSDDTEPALIKLSQLMRYNLYSANENKVDLEKEVQYLNDYIDIQKMRLPQNVTIKFNVEGNIENIRIEPLIFIPFVENAFKHGIIAQSKSEINIMLKVIPGSILFKTNNSVANNLTKDEDQSGIGLKNVIRRLSILYPDRHTISITNDGKLYEIDLKLEIHD